MVQVRRGTDKDVDALVEMGSRFFTYSAFSRFVPFDENATKASLLLLTERGVVLVAEREGTIVGSLVGIMAPVWFNANATTATELAWWVDEAYRGSTAAFKLHRAFEEWAKEQGATAIVMSDLIVNGVAHTEKLFEKMGFTPVERSHVKGVS